MKTVFNPFPLLWAACLLVAGASGPVRALPPAAPAVSMDEDPSAENGEPESADAATAGESERDAETPLSDTDVDEANVDETQVNEANVNEANVDETQVNEANVNTPNVDETDVDDGQVEASKVDAADVDEESPARPRVILLRLEAANVDAAVAKIVQGLFTSAAARQPGVDLVTIDDLAKSIDVEAQRQLLGCEDERVDSCLAEIAGALGARYIAYGQIGSLGELTLLQLHLFDSARARSINRVDLRVEDVEDLTEQMDPAIDKLFAPLTGRTIDATLGLGLPVGGGLLGVAGLSLAVAVAGGVLFASGLYAAREANNRTVFDPSYPSAVAEARQFAAIGTAGIYVGLAGVVGAALFASAGAAAFVLLE